MRFFRLSGPRNSRGQRVNDWPLVVREPYRIPAIVCSECGVSVHVARIRVPLPADSSEFKAPQQLPVAAWNKRRASWAKKLGVSIDRVRPGATVGPPMGRCVKPMKGDVAIPFPGHFWVTARVRDALEAAQVAGLSFSDVLLGKECGTLKLWELVVAGHAWRKGADPESSIECKICGLVRFPDPKLLSVDTTRWDGSDLFTLDYNPNIVVATARVAHILQDLKLRGLDIVPVD